MEDQLCQTINQCYIQTQSSVSFPSLTPVALDNYYFTVSGGNYVYQNAWLDIAFNEDPGIATNYTLFDSYTTFNQIKITGSVQ